MKRKRKILSKKKKKEETPHVALTRMWHHLRTIKTIDVAKARTKKELLREIGYLGKDYAGVRKYFEKTPNALEKVRAKEVKLRTPYKEDYTGRQARIRKAIYQNRIKNKYVIIKKRTYRKTGKTYTYLYSTRGRRLLRL